MISLFEAALIDPAVMRAVAQTIESVARQNGVATSPVSILKAAATNKGFVAALETALSQLATKDGLTFDPPGSGQPTVMLFIAAALVFMPRVFEPVGHFPFSGPPGPSGITGPTFGF